MPRPCMICSHERQGEVDAAIRNNEPYQSIAKRFGTSMVSILSHQGHLSGTLGTPTKAQEMARAVDMLAQMKTLQDHCFTLLQVAEGASELKTVFSAIGQVRKHLEALGGLTEQLHRDFKAQT